MSKKSDLIEKLCKAHPEIPKDDMSYVVSETFNHIIESISKGKRVELRGFGSFEMGEKNVVSTVTKNGSTIRKTLKYKQSTEFMKII